MFLYIYIHTVPAEVRRRWWIPWSWSYRWVWTTLHGLRKPNLALFEEQQVLLPARLFPTLVFIFVVKNSFHLSWQSTELLWRVNEKCSSAFEPLVSGWLTRCGGVGRYGFAAGNTSLTLGFMRSQAALSVQSPCFLLTVRYVISQLSALVSWCSAFPAIMDSSSGIISPNGLFLL